MSLWRKKKAPSEGSKAIAESEARLRYAIERYNETCEPVEEVKGLVEKLRQQRVENHFGERIRRALEV